MSRLPVARTRLERSLAGRPTIDLEGIQAVAALQSRHDRKYLVEPVRLAEVVAAVDVRVLSIGGRTTFAYRSTYFDTPDRLCHRDAARSRPSRFKVRTRTYVDSGRSWLEVKGRSARGRTVKDRIPHPLAPEDELTADGRAFLAGHDVVAPHVDRLEPALVTAYDRATLLCDQRVTVDVGLHVRTASGEPVRLGDLDELTIVETKSLRPGPGRFDRALWRAGVRPTRLSKYAVGLAAAEPDLPANKWHRVLHHHGVRSVVRPGSRPGEGQA